METWSPGSTSPGPNLRTVKWYAVFTGGPGSGPMYVRDSGFMPRNSDVTATLRARGRAEACCAAHTGSQAASNEAGMCLMGKELKI
jgi:hypothetical protein